MKTTKILGTIALLITLFTVPADAQTKVGLIGGLNRSDYVADDGGAVHSSRNGAVLGGVLDLTLTDNIHFRLEPLYIQKGGAAEDAALQEEVTLEASMLEVPLLMRIELGDPARPYLLVGPTVGFLLSADLSGSDTGVPFVTDLMDVSRRIELGLGVGGGWSRGLGRLSAFVEGRYVWGLTNMMKSGDVVLTSPGTTATATVTFDEEDDQYEYRGLQVLVGFTVPLGTAR